MCLIDNRSLGFGTIATLAIYIKMIFKDFLKVEKGFGEYSK